MCRNCNSFLKEHAFVRPFERTVGPTSPPEGTCIVINRLKGYLPLRIVRINDRILRQVSHVALDVVNSMVCIDVREELVPVGLAFMLIVTGLVHSH